MKKLLTNKPIMVALIAVALLGILALATSGERTLNWLESTVGSIFQPIQTFSYKTSTAIIDFTRELFNTTDADKENKQLRADNEKLKQLLSDYDNIKKENARLSGLLNFTKSFADTSFVTGQVIGRSTNVMYGVFTVNIGRNKGVEVGMPVVNQDGLIGRVTDVGATWCKITPIIDSSMSISVIVDRTRDNGMVRGALVTGNNVNRLELYYLPAGADIVPGDKLVTSSMGSSFPKGIAVGIVSEVQRSSEKSNAYDAIVEPCVDFLHLEEVMIIVDTSEVDDNA